MARNMCCKRYFSTKTIIGPAARSLLTQFGIFENQIGSDFRTGPNKILLKGDILKFVSDKKLKPAEISAASFSKLLVSEKKNEQTVSKKHSSKKVQPTPNPFVDLEMTGMRETIAKRLVKSKSTIAHSYTTTNCSVTNLIKIRSKMVNLGFKGSLNDYIIKSTGNALLKCPFMNIISENDKLKEVKNVDISVAVATKTGLITPIVFNVTDKDILQISSDLRSLIEKAKMGTLKPNEFMGGTFTISNLGMFGSINNFTAIINPPQCAILAVGGSQVHLDDDGDLDTKINLTLSYNSGAIINEDAAKFLAHLKNEIENTSLLSLGIYDLQSKIEIMELSANN